MKFDYTKKRMKIRVLSDNRTLNDSLLSEHGLCVYVETPNYKCLLDTGASDNFIRNAKQLGIDLTQIDYVFISHGHADHIGGLAAFLEINSKAKIVMSSQVLNQEFYSKRNGLHSISIKFDVGLLKDRVVYVDNEACFEDDIQVFKVHKTPYPLPQGNRTLFKDSGNGLELDDFDHELIVTFGTEDLVVFTGCGHKGLLNILNAITLNVRQSIRYVLGGFHLLDSTLHTNYESDLEITELSNYLRTNFPLTDFITGHCTGEQSYDQMKKVLESRLRRFFTGYTLEI